jgi:hypothetical protein
MEFRFHDGQILRGHWTFTMLNVELIEILNYRGPLTTD